MSKESVFSLDKQLKKTLARCSKPKLGPDEFEKAKEAARRVGEDAKSHGLDKCVEHLSQYFLYRERTEELGRTTIFPTEQFLELASEGFHDTLQFGVWHSASEFAKIPAARLLAAIGSPQVLAVIAKNRPTLLKEGIANLRDCAESREPMPKGAVWVVERAEMLALIPLVEVLINAPEKSLGSKLLERDRTGKALIAIVGAVVDGRIVQDTVASRISHSPKAARTFLSTLPRILSTANGGIAFSILQRWIDFWEEIPMEARPMISGALATFCGHLLIKPERRPAEQLALDIVGARMRSFAGQGGDRLWGFWTLYPLGVGPIVNGQEVSREAAEFLVEAIEKLGDPKYRPMDVFTALATNLGLEQMYTAGERIAFDFTLHRDTHGGLLSGHPAEVLKPGWKHKNVVIMKTLVKPVHSNV